MQCSAFDALVFRKGGLGFALGNTRIELDSF